MTRASKNQVRSKSIQKSLTGIEGFDQITYGGLPSARTTLVIGGPGAGKTIFALQVLVNGAALNQEPGIFVAFEESADQIIANAATFGWHLEDLEREKLFFLDARLSPATVKSGDFDLEGMLLGLEAKAKEMNAKRIVFDGLDVLLALLDDRSMEHREAYRLHEWLKRTGLTGVFTAKSDERDRITSERYAFMQFMVDCVVALQHDLVDRVSLRSLRVFKYRGSKFDEGQFPLVIAEDGIELSTFNTDEIDFTVSNERLPTGVRRLDTMLEGGYYRASTTIITGAPGVAKTTLATRFSAEQCKRGERVLYVSFDESADQLVRNLRSTGTDLQPYRDSGLLMIHALRTEARSAEEHLIVLKRIIRAFEPQHLVLDPVSALVKTGGQLSAVHAVFRILDYAKYRGITVLCTSLTSGPDPNPEATGIEISTIADNWIHLDYKILSGERNRTLTIVKARGIGHSNQVRELLLSDNGIELADVYTAGGEVLVGTARFEKEAQVRSTERRQKLEMDLKRAQLKAMEVELASRIEALKHELETKRTEIAVFEEEVSDNVFTSQDYDHRLRILRNADVTGGE